METLSETKGKEMQIWQSLWSRAHRPRNSNICLHKAQEMPNRLTTELENDNHKVHFYTGLPSYEILIKAFDHISAHVTRKSLHLSKFQEFVMVLLKLRLNAPLQDLAYRFRTSVSTVSRTFAAWMVVMDARLSPLISWPDREDLWATMPQCFQYSFGKKTTVVIDCFEVFIDRPSSLLARAQTFSSYKHHNTIKVLIGITPQGTIAFTSEAWGGRTSDKFLTENCGFLDKLLPGDMVMADCGFTVQESVMFKQAQLVIPGIYEREGSAVSLLMWRRPEGSPMSGSMSRGSLAC